MTIPAVLHRALASARIQGRRLGIAISSHTVHALLLERGQVTWAGAAEYSTTDELTDVIARLAGECGRPVRRARVVLAREVVQLRSLVPAPPLKARAVARYVGLEAPRLFRRNGKALVTAGRLVPVAPHQHALWAAAAEEPLLRAVLSGCAQAGIEVDDIGPASEVLPRALSGSSGARTIAFSSEVIEVGPGGAWRSRLVRGQEGAGSGERFVPEVETLGPGAGYAAAYAAARAQPRLSLLPPDTRAARAKRERRRVVRLALVAGGLWVLAGVAYVARLVATTRAAEAELARLAPAVDSALVVHRELGLARLTLATLADAERRRSRHLELLAMLTKALGDSIHLVTLRVAPDGTVRLAGYAPVAARALAALERVTWLHDPRFEGPVTRETRAGARETWDRFAVVALLQATP